MHFPTLLSIVGVLAVGATALPGLQVRDDTAAIFGIFDDASCSVNQRDVSGIDRKCYDLPGQSMKIWWLKKGCGVVTLSDRQCHFDASIQLVWNKCVDISKAKSWSIYCEP